VAEVRRRLDTARQESKSTPAATRVINRELSWLDFNQRVLALAADDARPPLERAKFLAIFSQNLDDFFQIRVAGLKEQINAGLAFASPDHMSPIEQLAAIRIRVQDLLTHQASIYADHLVPRLAQGGICVVGWEDLADTDRRHLKRAFEERVFPVLTPLSVDPAHPFPYISNLSLNLAVVVRDRVTKVRRFARVKVPPLLPRFVAMPDGRRFIPLEQVIAAHLSALFPGMEIVAHHVFRVTRDADLEVEVDEADDLLEAIESIIRQRQRSPEAVRLEVNPSMPEDVRDLLVHELGLDAADVFVVDGLLDMSGLWAIHELDHPELKDEPWTGVTPPRLSAVLDGDARDVFEVLREGDVLVHHPYDSFATTVEAFVDEASRDPSVLAIKQTLYRTSERDSPIVHALIRAAESGKQAVALVELTARFDERANIGWARLMEEAGVHVVYGVVGLKTHAKIALVVRQEGARIRRYCHVGTGNYNHRTATIYEDVGLLTADPDVTADVADLFNYLTGYSRQRGYRRIMVAPITLRSRVVDMIRQQGALGPDGRICLKMNSLVDLEMIEALYEASVAGTPIDLVVRGICCLRAGVPGMSETVRVRSIVGRYLEHSRIFRFGGDQAGEGARYFFGSADLMPRNLDRRVECMVEVADPLLQARLQEILAVNLLDDVLAWNLQPDGTYQKLPTVEGVETHRTLQRLALERAGVKPPSRRG
jgi:polyphosphate kinase